MPMGPPDENWTLPSWAVNSSNEEIQDQKANIQIESQESADDLTPEETPAAASEFSNQQQNNRKQAPPTPVQPVSSRKAEPDSPSVFDIGLSDATIKMFVNKAKPQSARHQDLSPVSLPSKVISTAKTKASANQKTSGQKSPVPPTIINFSAAYQEPEHDLTTDQDQDQDPGQDSTLGASPELQLRSALPSLQVFPNLIMISIKLHIFVKYSYSAERLTIPAFCPICQTCPSRNLMLRKERLALAFPAGDSLLFSFRFALNSVHLTIICTFLRTTPEPQEEVTSNAAPPCLSSSRMLHRLTSCSLLLVLSRCFSPQCQPRPISGATRAANNKLERHYQPAKSSKKRHPGGAGA